MSIAPNQFQELLGNDGPTYTLTFTTTLEVTLLAAFIGLPSIEQASAAYGNPALAIINRPLGDENPAITIVTSKDSDELPG